MADKPQQDALARYWSKRNFAVTSEPRGDVAASGAELAFVVQKHHASRLHYDFRLELGGVMLSWAVPKGPSYDPTDKRMAIHVEDHPLSYNSFEGTIPPKQYGAGTVIVWDNGTWEPTIDPQQGLKDGKLVFALHGHKLFGLWELVRIAKPGDKQDAWLLFKKRDRHAKPRSEYDVVSALPDSVIAKPLKATTTNSAGPTDAVKAPLPATLAPQLASLASAAPTSGAWSWEIKLDGYRLMARIDDGKARLITRGGHDWSAKMPALVKAVQSLGLKSAWLDGEIVVLGKAGTPEFNALQNAFDRSRTESIDYFLFDLPYFEGHDLRATPLVQRRQLLKQLLDEHPHEHLRFSADFDADAASILESARRMGLEGVIAKRKDAPYESRRTETWLKLKNKLRQEFVVAGYSDRSSGEAEIGSLLLGVHDDGGQLVYVGNVGTGWDAKTAAKLKTQLKKIEVAASPFGSKPLHQHRWAVRDPAAQHFVKPTLVAEVEFSDWTPDSQIRHAKFLGLRIDKDPKTVKRENAVMPEGPALVTAGSSIVGGIKVSHPERVIDASTGITKLELVRYYESVAEWMLPHLKGRPCSLVRGPSGVGGELFFQKHIESLQITGIKELDAALWPGHASLLEVPTKQGTDRRGADERHRVSYVERDDKKDRPARSRDLRPRPRRRRALGACAGSGDAGAPPAAGAGAAMLVEDQWRQGPARRGAADAARRLGHRESVRAGRRAAHRERDPAALYRQDGRGQPRRQTVRRLPAQQPRRDDGRRVLGALAAGAGRVDADRLGRPSYAQTQRSVERAHGARAPVVSDGGSVAGLQDVPSDVDGGTQGARPAVRAGAPIASKAARARCSSTR